MKHTRRLFPKKTKKDRKLKKWFRRNEYRNNLLRSEEKKGVTK